MQDIGGLYIPASMQVGGKHFEAWTGCNQNFRHIHSHVSRLYPFHSLRSFQRSIQASPANRLSRCYLSVFKDRRFWGWRHAQASVIFWVMQEHFQLRFIDSCSKGFPDMTLGFHVFDPHPTLFSCLIRLDGFRTTKEAQTFASLSDILIAHQLNPTAHYRDVFEFSSKRTHATTFWKKSGKDV
jgi:hypothetical protein